MNLAPSLDVRSAELLLALTPGVGPRLRKALIDHFGSAQGILQAAASDLRAVPGIGVKVSRAIVTARNEIDVERELADCREQGVELVVESSDEYPEQLRTIHDPPGVLFVRGSILPSDASRSLSSARGTPRTMAWPKPSGWRGAWRGPAMRSSAAWPAASMPPPTAER
jgi:NAD-dependent DNA ligase